MFRIYQDLKRTKRRAMSFLTNKGKTTTDLSTENNTKASPNRSLTQPEGPCRSSLRQRKTQFLQRIHFRVQDLRHLRDARLPFANFAPGSSWDIKPLEATWPSPTQTTPKSIFKKSKFVASIAIVGSFSKSFDKNICENN